MRLTVSLTMIYATFLMAGCSPKVLPPTEAAFCDVEEQRRFTQIELDWRAENAPANLRRDFKTNTTWERECING